MEFRPLGQTGLDVSVVSLGTWQLSGPVTLDGKADGFADPGKRVVVDFVRQCGDRGINLIDCAEVYGDGEGEKRVGEAIRRKRDRWLVCTKYGLRRGPQGQRLVDPSPEAIRPSVERSLARLRTDYIDILLSHVAPDRRSVDRSREVLESLRSEGKIRCFGVSTNDTGLLRNLISSGAVQVVMISRSLLRHDRALLEVASRAGLGIMVRGALEWGRLSGKYFHRDPVFGDDDIRKRMFEPSDFRRCSDFEELLPPETSMVSFAVRYLLDNDRTHTVVSGSRSIAGLEDILRAIALPRLDPRTHSRIAAMRVKINGGEPGFRTMMRDFGRALSNGLGLGGREARSQQA
jgi:aryl-alcohol dehydrogenase-like predicted oxidoreductase